MIPSSQSARTREICALAPVIPVIVVPEARQAEGLGRALVEGGLTVLEVTLRTEAALPAIRDMTRIEGAIVGAGTVLRPDDVYRAKDAGARFAVSPGLTEDIALACQDAALPLLPGAATLTEMMRAMQLGYDMLKFFPAEAAGGAKAVAAAGGPLAELRFCPTGGISLQNAPDYLRLSNVACVGGSWVCPTDRVKAGDWDVIRQLAAEAAALPRG
ncbi:MAG: bifunctional 4-hydroxy-2-oxoglutarate aldolase/2-dehydro-3-deoxy-phosphogluconate aldolase [Paracoccus sp. (in: a-proteobacteria)]|uniref:bifunctional 4-hydroxy-2-oxoglutarate aldolase/2-dehydro-3-deoxy-phosphogluconate aldolase n=1 Tax=Paracoccus sp. TaxID=267 RepID=UPI0026DFA940|nr:bifunctional 4-hydroxy-2-oxoglutarate aldolase/2-dehydro-3-deoxy-phosphogluconate aldolase [Paracoccus sp. (in: a-proteobacteria)]MDO5621364.1 bifunctional 4-hydroxy-2-oxoglutarate aldolase/2-dehydro-3-deoxy-phosphogluconate aldolase [Paracoccus sp. (in: a-proteobacteria)]